jgi:hypothetical protein
LTVQSRVWSWNGGWQSRARLHAHSRAYDEVPTCTLQTSELVLRLLNPLQQGRKYKFSKS